MPLNRVQLQQNTNFANPAGRTPVDTTSLDQLNAISSVQGLNLIVSNRFDNVTAVSVNNCFSNLYQNYRVLLTLTNVISDADFTLRLRSGGFDNVSNLYNTMFLGIDNSAVASNSTSSSTSSWVVGESDNSAGITLPNKYVRYKLSLDFFSPAELENTTIMGQYDFINKAATAAISRVGSGQYQYITPFDGFSFISSVASNISGVVRVYGYRI